MDDNFVFKPFKNPELMLVLKISARWKISTLGLSLANESNECPDFRVIANCKMTRLLAFLLTIFVLTFVACKSNKTENELTKLEQYINSTDSLTGSSKLFDQLVINILTDHSEFKVIDDIKHYQNNSLGKLKEQTFNFYNGTIGQYPNLSYDLKITEFKTDRQAAVAFWKIIEFQACCVPNEDIIKLKNFENLGHFKNNASTTLLSENVLFELAMGDRENINKEISKSLDRLLEKRKYLKLEIGQGGPAIWTRK
ncbi:hypothetical protein [Haliscomenobacter sp.]|uniref:hypothetical protein n=1 Tax=Haliscomenobacter sp. TaxID=2717303 RepID=UPI003BAD401D